MHIIGQRTTISLFARLRIVSRRAKRALNNACTAWVCTCSYGTPNVHQTCEAYFSKAQRCGAVKCGANKEMKGSQQWKDLSTLPSVRLAITNVVPPLILIIMFRLLLLASTVRASLYDAQQPLRGSSLDVVVPLTVSRRRLASCSSRLTRVAAR